MAALIKERSTVRYGQEPTPALWSIKMKAATRVFAGGIACVEAGYACPGGTAATGNCLGRFEQTVDNTAGAAGALVVDILTGVFKWANGAGADAVTQADLFQYAYAIDDQTVARVATGRAKAGMIIGVEADGVWVLMGWAHGK